MEQMMEWVLPNGYLNEQRVTKREPLYTGTNGRQVERFFVNPSESYVFKPLTNPSQLGKERWIYEQVLPSLNLPTPKVMAASESTDPAVNWMILEDLSPLHHTFNEDVVLEIARLIARWHTHPVEALIDYPLKGPKPSISEMALTVLLRREELLDRRNGFSVQADLLHKLEKHLEIPFSKQSFFSHGDLHLGNYALTGERVVVLDWEHAHLDLPYWDLYHLMDLSHPLFPKKVTADLRENGLDAYLQEALSRGLAFEIDLFKKEYYRFAAIFSTWMLLLIKKDLVNPRKEWVGGKLTDQWHETLGSLNQCLKKLS